MTLKESCALVSTFGTWVLVLHFIALRSLPWSRPKANSYCFCCSVFFLMAREIRQRIISCVDPQASGESSRAGKQQVGAWCLLYMRAWSVSQGQEPFHCYGAAVRCSFQKKEKKSLHFFKICCYMHAEQGLVLAHRMRGLCSQGLLWLCW